MKTTSKFNALCVPLFAACIGLLLSTSCKKQESNVPAGGTIQIGSILALTGPAASYGEMMQRGLQLAEAEINAADGVAGKHIQVLVEDSQFAAPKALSAFQKLTEVQNVKVIVGITGSKIALPVAEAAKSGKCVIVDALSTAPALTGRGGHAYFRVIASDAFAGKYNTDWAIEEGMKKPAIIYVEDEWGSSYRISLQDYLKTKGFSEPLVEGIKAGDRDFRTQVQKVKDYGADAIFLLTYSNEGAPFVQQLRQGGLTSKVYGSDNLSSPEFVTAGASVIEGVRVALPVPAGGTEYEKFVKSFKDKFGMPPDVNALKSYDALHVAVKAIRQAGVDPEKISQYLLSPAFSHKGVTGEIRFDQNGDLLSQQYQRQIYRDGALAPF